jgi:hypothetical protein
MGLNFITPVQQKYFKENLWEEIYREPILEIIILIL